MPSPDAAEVWESTFARHCCMWGPAPAESARLAAARFAALGLRKVLIPGVGYGRNAVPFLEAGMEVVGIEISETAIRLAREVHGHDFPIHCGSVTEMPLADGVFGGTFDGIYCHGLVYLLGPADRARFLRACQSQLRPGGRLIVSAITKTAPMYGQGRRLGPDWFQTHPGVSLFFYDEVSIAQELGPLGLVGFTPLSERSVSGVPLPSWQIAREAPPACAARATTPAMDPALPLLPAPADLAACVDLAELHAALPRLQRAFSAAVPFPHVVVQGLLRPGLAEAAEAAFPAPGDPLWTHYRHLNERKQGSPKREVYPEAVARVVRALQSPEFVAWLEQLTGVSGLFPDPELEGAGMHLSQRGGFLNVHTDFQRHHHHPRWRRTVNLILFLNSGWQAEWGGAIELWPADMARCEQAVLPELNTAVIFRSDARSFHGHPHPLACPPERSRRSLALYYYTLLDGTLEHEYSRFAALPEDSRAKRLGMRLDNELVRLFSWLKRRGAARDAWASRVLRRLDRLRGDG